MRLRSSIAEVWHLTREDRDAMFALMGLCYANLARVRFEADLDSKETVILVHHPSSGELVGFSTQVVLHTAVKKKPIHALYSGDTVVKPCHWGDTALAHEWGRFALGLIDRNRSDNLYWFLTSKGFRTYRYLPLFFRQYFPKAGRELTCGQAEFIDVLGRLVGGNRYDPACQVIRATAEKDYVRRGVSNPGLRLHRDPHVRFFVRQNPGYAKGDELCCVAPLSGANFTPAAYRVIHASSTRREAM